MKKCYFFTKKELLESWRTKRVLLLVIIFLIFGLMNPLLAKLTPEIMKSAFGSTLVTIPEPTSLDSWTQFYKNITQMGIYLVAVLFSGSVSREVASGSLVNLVTKGLDRWQIILSKYLVMLVQWIGALLLCFSVTAGYTHYYFPDNQSPHIFAGFFPLLLFGCFFVAVILFGSTLAKSSYEGLLFTIIVTALLYLLQLFDRFKAYNPISLISENMAWLKGDTLNDFCGSMILSVLFAGMFLSLSILVFNRKKL
ncbi:ABC transporter permease [Enterococcus songbeiensis]|uniref:ABC transporter permease n=1 Tax=Enterococcus songbeiensis TaxID=2559927 RepID=UPI0010F68D5E|nr:ABC transporter permease subunit [Enterococcus songbeiensis]